MILLYYNNKTMIFRDLTGKTMGNFNFVRVIGEGAFSVVYYAICTNDGSECAIKVIPKTKIESDIKLSQLIKTEVKVLKACNNQNIIRFISSFTDKNSIFIATEYCNGGDLHDYVVSRKYLSEEEATTFLSQILNGFKVGQQEIIGIITKQIQGLHQAGIMHRDLKLANVLVHNGSCKIGDLGFAKFMIKSMTRSYLGTTETMAPEVLAEVAYGMQADIWSVGVVYYQMIFGRFPYEADSPAKMLAQIRRSPPSFCGANISKNCRDFLQRCLQEEPTKRFTWQQLYTHPLLEDYQTRVKLIYRNNSKSRIKENADFYQKQGKQERKKEGDQKYRKTYLAHREPDSYGEELQAQDTPNYKQILTFVNHKNEVESSYSQYYQQYIYKRNDIIFIFKFIIPTVHSLAYIKANHNTCMFILAKKVYLTIKEFYQQVINQNNLFKFGKYFQTFVDSKEYQELKELLKNDLEVVRIQCKCYQGDIQNCNQQIRQEFNIEVVRSKDYNKLQSDIIQEYWYLLASSIEEATKNGDKQLLLEVLEALTYLNQNKNRSALQFDRMMSFTDMIELQRRVMAKYMKQFKQ